MWEIVANNLRSSADWRRNVAQRHPDDAVRNVRASELLDRLADQVEAINDPILLMRYGAACEEDVNVYLSEAEQEAVRQIGFGSEPENGVEFIEGVLDQLSR